MHIRVGFGIGVTASYGMTSEDFFQIIDSCEALGWDSIWFSERATQDVPDPLTALAVTAGRTQRLKFGTSVLVVPGRNPVLLAKELATIDHLSRGRLIPAFGLGGDADGEQEAFGVPRREAALRTEEAVTLMKGLWSQDQVSFEGRYFRVSNLTIHPRPVQQPHPDVWFGGRSRPALRRVARLGEGWLPSFIAPREYESSADYIRKAADSFGREISEEHYGALIPYIPTDAAVDETSVLRAISARRPDIDPNEVIAANGHEGLIEKIEQFVWKGASKFVAVPVVAPKDWGAELGRLKEKVVLVER